MILVIWGEDKSCKNTLALSFPKPLVDMELDIGGFRRSLRNLPHLPIKDWYDQKLITVEQFVMPFQLAEDFDPVKDIIRPDKIVRGVKELFYQFAVSFIKKLKDPNVATIMVDTGTLLSEITAGGYLQELQERQLPLRQDGLGKDGKTLRTRLQQQEYTERNIRMRGFAYQAKAHGKHLVVTHHAADEYSLVRLSDGTTGEGRTGKRIMHGWGQWGDSADVLGRTYWEPYKKEAHFKVELAEVKELEGMDFIDPTFEKLDTFIRMIRGE